MALGETFLEGYVTCALWSSMDNSALAGYEPLDSNYDASDFTPESMAKMKLDCDTFEQENANALDKFYDAGYDPGRAGHDFWLTRNGHGSGFWDEQAPEDVMEALTTASKAFGEEDIEVGDDGRLHIMGINLPNPSKRNRPTASLLNKPDPWKAEIRRGLAITGRRKKADDYGWMDVPTPRQGESELESALRGLLNWAVGNGSSKTGNPYLIPEVGVALKALWKANGKEFPETKKHKLKTYPSYNEVGKPVQVTIPENEPHEGSVVSHKASLNKNAVKIETRVAEGKADPTPEITRLLNEHHAEMEAKNPRGFMDAFEAQLDSLMFDVAQQLGLSLDMEGDTYVFSDAAGKGYKPQLASLKTAMSRKDYILIADALKAAQAGGAADVETVANHIAQALKADNPNFNSQHFLAVVTGKKELTSRPPQQRFAPGHQRQTPLTSSSKQGGNEVKRINVGDVGEAVMPFSEVCMHMGVAGKRMAFKLLSDRAVQLADPQTGRMFSAPIILGEAGIFTDDQGYYYYPNQKYSSKPRLAGAKLGGIAPELIQQAKQLIEEDDPIIYDVAADSGQIVDNVKHMSWFVREVAEWLAEDPSYYQYAKSNKSLEDFLGADVPAEFVDPKI